jgi:prepilin peptidase CpaA
MVNAVSMNMEIITYALLGGLAIGLLISVYSDIKYRLIYNYVTLPIALAAPLFWYATGTYGIWDVAIHLATGACVFAFFAFFFSVGMMGGGDVKLFSAIALWFEWTEVLRILFIASLIGGAVTIVFLIIHKFRKQQGQARIPYGVAIALAGLLHTSELFFNHFG